MLTIALPFLAAWQGTVPAHFSAQLKVFSKHPLISRILILHETASPPWLRLAAVSAAKFRYIKIDSCFSTTVIEAILETADSNILIFSPPASEIEIEDYAFRRILDVADATGAGIIYSDFREARGNEFVEHSTLDYQLGSIRESFDFGAFVFISKHAAEQAVGKNGGVESGLRWAGFYDLRLKVSIDFPVVRIEEPLYSRRPASSTPSPSALTDRSGSFDMAASRNRDYQLEVERIATAHLRRIGALVERAAEPPPVAEDSYPVTASIIIPVRNRQGLVAEAVRSALSQVTPFPFNIIVVDDHSTDRTAEIVRQLAAQYANVIYRSPTREDLGIGGLWNEAIYSPQCGLYAVQLDSDDVFATTDSLKRLIRKFSDSKTDEDCMARRFSPRYAMVVGSFTHVDFNLKEIAPGLSQFLDLSEENGRNNILRLEGPGAPRAFYVPLLRRFAFPNVSFGEDYALCLQMSREYEIGRILDSIYLARQWEGNTARSLPLSSHRSVNIRDLMPSGFADEAGFLARMRPLLSPLLTASKSRYQAYKDWLRTMEIQARKKLKQSSGSGG